MPVREAIYDETRADGGEDVQRILRHWRAAAPTALLNDQQIISILKTPPGKEFVYLDDVEDVVVRLVAMAFDPPKSWECIVSIWSWVGAQRVAVLPCLRTALQAFVSYYPTSGTWPIWGDLPTQTEANALKVAFGGTRVEVNASQHPGYWRASSTVGTILTRLAIISP